MTDPMTPTEQDVKLHSKSYKLAQEYLMTDNLERFVDLIQNNLTLDEALQLIAADRKRVALEARIDEINYLDDNFQADSQDWEREHPGFSTAMIPMEDYIRRRTELKLEQSFEKR